MVVGRSQEGRDAMTRLDFTHARPLLGDGLERGSGPSTFPTLRSLSVCLIHHSPAPSLIHLPNMVQPPVSKPPPPTAATASNLDASNDLTPQQRSEMARNLLGSAAADDTEDDGTGQGKNLNVVRAYKAHFREDPWQWLGQLYQYQKGTGWRACELSHPQLLEQHSRPLPREHSQTRTTLEHPSCTPRSLPKSWRA